MTAPWPRCPICDERHDPTPTPLHVIDARIDGRCYRVGDRIGLDATHDLHALRAEIGRLRALPVLRTCGECRWCEPVSVPPSPSCQHPRTLATHSIGYMPVDVDAAPPSWCPQRGSTP